jgi:uncharacterized protein YkwD
MAPAGQGLVVMQHMHMCRGSDGSDLATRAKRAGFNTYPIGENVAAGQTSALQVVAAWMW